ncbi:hypothetical protein IAR55_000039 [Kwoniella newhampshirensis]|uniref:Uncharacterized protein n=1 Tax=Kwoniella newhampshirensis TaxID=1651941 RepID=A0AAW0Z626_9TREE
MSRAQSHDTHPPYSIISPTLPPPPPPPSIDRNQQQQQSATAPRFFLHDRERERVSTTSSPDITSSTAIVGGAQTHATDMSRRSSSATSTSSNSHGFYRFGRDRSSRSRLHGSGSSLSRDQGGLRNVLQNYQVPPHGHGHGHGQPYQHGQGQGEHVQAASVTSSFSSSGPGGDDGLEPREWSFDSNEPSQIQQSHGQGGCCNHSHHHQDRSTLREPILLREDNKSQDQHRRRGTSLVAQDRQPIHQHLERSPDQTHPHPLGHHGADGQEFERGSEEMDALVEIHRVLYRGKEDLEMDHRVLKWEDQGKEVKRVVERWFEGDCVYDHPLLRVTSRQSLLMHFILLHLLSTLYLPSITPSALLQHARNLTSRLRNRLLGIDRAHDLSKKSHIQKKQLLLPKEPAEEEEWLGLPLKQGGRGASLIEEDNLSDGEEDEDGWWKLWDVRADCKEIGEMECYDGYHLAMIEHVITLTLFPSISTPRNPLDPISSRNSYASLPSNLKTAGHGGGASASFSRRLVAGLATEFDGLLQWDLPISTMVQFNEVGKATHVRDMIDIRDAFETFVPFAKCIGWLTRHLTGMVTSTLGALALSFVSGGANLKQVSEPSREGVQLGKGPMTPVKQRAQPIGLGLQYPAHTKNDDQSRPITKENLTHLNRTPAVPRSKSLSVPSAALNADPAKGNSLGLEGLIDGKGVNAASAPDVDIETQSI